jgi:hypothetical protein
MKAEPAGPPTGPAKAEEDEEFFDLGIEPRERVSRCRSGPAGGPVSMRRVKGARVEQVE